jgi:hypothetical protein
MSTIRAVCPHCLTPVDLEPAHILLLPRTVVASLGTYMFYCRGCEHVVSKSASQTESAVLEAAGVAAEPVAPSAGPTSKPVTDHRPFTPDDLIDFHQILTSDHWFSRLTCG